MANTFVKILALAKLPCVRLQSLWTRIRFPVKPRRVSAGVLIQAISLATLMGCAIKRDKYDVPSAPVPEQFKQSLVHSSGEACAEPGREPCASPIVRSLQAGAWLDEWWLTLQSPELNALIDQALANNADLRIAMLRVAQAQARAEQADADELPIIKAPFEAHQDAPSTGVNSATGFGSIKDRQYYQGGISGDWRIDVWGELRSMAESAEMHLWRTTYQKDDARRTLIATVVAQYLEYLSLNDRLRVAHETETVLHNLLHSVDERMKAGDATVIDLDQQRAADFAAMAAIPGLALQRETVVNELAQSLGTTPGALTLSDNGIDSLAFPGMMPDIPAALLLRRPDIRAVEAQLLATDADIDVARARLLPPLSLSAKSGWGFLTLSPIFFQPYGAIYNLVSNLTVTIFDHGRRAQDVAFARSLHEELVETYVKAIYMAIQEAENAIVGTRKNTERLDAQRAATDASLRAWKHSEESYSAGDIDFLKLLDTERTYHRNLDELHSLALERYKSLIALYSALGGGVPQGGALPGDGERPGGGAAAPASNSLLYRTAGIHWKDGDDAPQDDWLIELTGLQDRAGVGHAWRDLQQRFPDLMKGRSAIPRLQGRVKNEHEERATWYRVFIGRYVRTEDADAACGQLNSKQVRCRVVAADAEAFRAVLEDELPQALLDCAAAPSLDSCRAEMPPLITAAAPLPVVATPTPPPRAPSRPTDIAQQTPSTARRGYTIQLHAMLDPTNAENAAAAWNRMGYKAYISPQITVDGHTVYSVRTGMFKTRAQADAGIAVLRRRNKKVDAFPVPIDLDNAQQTAQVKLPRHG